MKGAYRIFIAALLVAMLAWPAAATTVTFQLNMSVQEDLGTFDPDVDIVVVRGTFNDWIGNAEQLLYDEGLELYTVDVEIAEGDHEYKFVMVQTEMDVWENDQRFVTISGATQLVGPFYFNDVQQPILIETNFRVNMNIQAETEVFDPDVDWVVVRGGHANLGSWGGAVRLTEETGNPNVYSAWIQFDDLEAEQEIRYKFVILVGGDENNASWEALNDPAHDNNRYFIPSGEEADLLPPPSGNGYGEITPELVYFSNTGPDDIITRDLNVVFRVEVTPIDGRINDEGYIYHEGSEDTIWTVESIEVAGEFNEWPWENFSPDHTLNDNGTNGDETAGDRVFSGTILFPSGTGRELIYKYGLNSHDAEAGFAMNHVRTLNDDEDTFVMPIDCFGSPDTLYQDWPCTISSTDEPGAPAPTEYTLSQNFPNPFNPSTTISFSIPLAENVKLSVFDILGRQVSVMDFGRLNVGTHNVEFNAGSFASGVYFYKLETANYTATKKMLLMK